MYFNILHALSICVKFTIWSLRLHSPARIIAPLLCNAHWYVCDNKRNANVPRKGNGRQCVNTRPNPACPGPLQSPSDEGQSPISNSKAERGSQSVFIDTECWRRTDRPLRMIKRLSVQILWNVAFQTLKGKGDHHGNGTWGLEMGGFPWELKSQQNFKHLQLKKEDDENRTTLPNTSTEMEYG